MNVADLFSLSQTQRRLAHEYKQWALEDEKAGRIERCRQNRKRSDDLWHQAKANLCLARRCAIASTPQIQTFARAA